MQVRFFKFLKEKLIFLVYFFYDLNLSYDSCDVPLRSLFLLGARLSVTAMTA